LTGILKKLKCNVCSELYPFINVWRICFEKSKGGANLVPEAPTLEGGLGKSVTWAMNYFHPSMSDIFVLKSQKTKGG
jgi:hypothetical protein